MRRNTKKNPKEYYAEAEYEHDFWEAVKTDAASCRRLFLAVIERSIRDAQGPKVSGDDSEWGVTKTRIQDGAIEFFKRRGKELKGWGWYITMLGLEDSQVREIEQQAGIIRNDPKAAALC